MPRCALMILLALIATLSNATASWATPAVTAMRFIPLVVPETYALPVTFEATTAGSPASVAFQYGVVDRAMYNDGTHGDRVAGDAIWTIQFSADEILSKLTPASVYRPFIGFCTPAGGGRFNVFAQVWTSAIGLASVLSRTSTVQQTDHVVNIVESAVELQAFDTTVMTKHFYTVYPDAYDFLNIVSVAGQVANRHHESASNAVSGLGQMLFNNTATYWSAGRLKGVTVFPIPTLFDGASTTFSHETGHQWMVFLSGPLWASGVPHWPKGDVAGNVMGFSIAGPGGEGGDFHYTFTPNGLGGYVVGNSPDSVSRAFNSMELYLMGLIPPAQVGTFFVLNDQTITPAAGDTIPASRVTTFDVNTVIAANGARVPDSAAIAAAAAVAPKVAATPSALRCVARTWLGPSAMSQRQQRSYPNVTARSNSAPDRSSRSPTASAAGTTEHPGCAFVTASKSSVSSAWANIALASAALTADVRMSVVKTVASGTPPCART